MPIVDVFVLQEGRIACLDVGDFILFFCAITGDTRWPTAYINHVRHKSLQYTHVFFFSLADRIQIEMM